MRLSTSTVTSRHMIQMGLGEGTGESTILDGCHKRLLPEMGAELTQLREVSHLPGLAVGRQRTGPHLEQGQTHNGHRVLSSLPLQMLLYFNVFFLPFWGLSEAIMLELKVPELAGFLLLSVVIEMPVLLFVLTDHQVIRMPLEMAVHGVLLCFLTSEIVAASFALKGIARHLARQFYLMQCEGRPGRVRHQELCGGNHQP
ncbi:transmembrane protein 17B-like isoform X3 [Crotalus tigris]|uniref:transmembrane protein 17B-like isoform X3 n=1 Tax=Crotalus tigris TaxID=88082 RepID=UPI00192FAEDF|nr:transmembrane protein 17B-like isoform X3 [Crotalus tigris]